MTIPSPFSRGPGIVSRALHALVSQIPASLESPSHHPAERAKLIAKTAAMKAATVSGSFTLPPGPFGMATVLPDLLAVWRIQQQMVADIAATFGKTRALSSETMVICLFRHGGAALTQALFSHDGNEVVVQRIARRTLLQLLEKIAVRLTQRIAAKSMSRWLPVLGALGAGAYAYYDTAHVATNAIDLFSRDLRITEGESETENVATVARRKPAPAATRTKSRRTAATPSRAAPRQHRGPKKRSRETAKHAKQPKPREH